MTTFKPQDTNVNFNPEYITPHYIVELVIDSIQVIQLKTDPVAMSVPLFAIEYEVLLSKLSTLTNFKLIKITLGLETGLIFQMVEDKRYITHRLQLSPDCINALSYPIERPDLIIPASSFFKVSEVQIEKDRESERSYTLTFVFVSGQTLKEKFNI